MISAFGRTVKALRKAHQLTQAELAEQLHITPQAVSKWETGRGLPDLCLIVPLADVFGVSTDSLLGMFDGKEHHT